MERLLSRKMSKPIGTRFHDETLKALARRAAKEARSVGFLIRRYVEQGLQTDKGAK